MIFPFRFMCNLEIKYYYFFLLWLIILRIFHCLEVLHRCLKLVFAKPKYILFWYFVASYLNCEIFLSTIEHIEHFQAWTWRCCKWLSGSFVGWKHAWSGNLLHASVYMVKWWCIHPSLLLRSTACVKVECVCFRERVNIQSTFIEKHLCWLIFKISSISYLSKNSLKRSINLNIF